MARGVLRGDRHRLPARATGRSLGTCISFIARCFLQTTGAPLTVPERIANNGRRLAAARKERSDGVD
jgi:hypothetical protein